LNSHIIPLPLLCFWQESKGRGYEKYEWMDDPLPVFQRELVRDLRDAVWEKMEENRALLDENNELLDQLRKLKQSGGVHAQLQKQAAEIEHIKVMADGGNNLLFIWICSMVFAVYVGIMMSST
jgi:regulator of replication initiation timing